MTNTPAREGLPELPEPVGYMERNAWGPKPDYYTADQMRDYAVAYAATLSQPAQGGGEARSPYGYCPICGAKGAARERRLDGDDICAKNHKYPSRAALPSPQPEKGEPSGLERQQLCWQHRPGQRCPTPQSCSENGCSAVEREQLTPPPPSEMSPEAVEQWHRDDYERLRQEDNARRYAPPSDAAQGVQAVRVDEPRILSVEEIAIAKAAEHPLEFVTVRTADLRAALRAHKGEGNG
jgi:hypothetical protein